MTDAPEYLLRDEVADKLRLTARSIDRLCADGKLAKVQLGPRRVGITAASLAAYLKEFDQGENRR